jgi:hypothetical protein
VRPSIPYARGVPCARGAPVRPSYPRACRGAPYSARGAPLIRPSTAPCARGAPWCARAPDIHTRRAILAHVSPIKNGARPNLVNNPTEFILCARGAPVDRCARGAPALIGHVFTALQRPWCAYAPVRRGVTCARSTAPCAVRCGATCARVENARGYRTPQRPTSQSVAPVSCAVRRDAPMSWQPTKSALILKALGYPLCFLHRVNPFVCWLYVSPLECWGCKC